MKNINLTFTSNEGKLKAIEKSKNIQPYLIKALVISTKDPEEIKSFLPINDISIVDKIPIYNQVTDFTWLIVDLDTLPEIKSLDPEIVKNHLAFLSKRISIITQDKELLSIYWSFCEIYNSWNSLLEFNFIH